MPYDSIDAARKAGFPTSLDDIDLTLSQINKLAEIHDAIKKAGSTDNPMAVAWTQWKKLYNNEGGVGWIERSGVPTGLEAATLSFGSLNKITDDPNGDTIFHNVTLLAEGTWTDGHSKQTTRYTGNELEKMHIEKTTMKMDHDIFGKLPITNEIGLIENPKFVRDPIAKWLGDVRIFPTQNGNDTATLLKRGKITDISSELFLKPAMNSKTMVADATNMVFMGAATVRQGACTVCKFNEGANNMAETPIEPAAGGNEPVAAPVIDKAPDIVALEAQITERENALASQTAGELKMAHDKIVELEASVVALKAQMEANDHDVKVRELQKKYEALSKQPVIHTIVAGATAPAQAVELDSGDFEAYSAYDFTED
jgi:hypothetical protein